jgi:hypothetical protein
MPGRRQLRRRRMPNCKQQRAFRRRPACRILQLPVYADHCRCILLVTASFSAWLLTSVVASHEERCIACGRDEQPHGGNLRQASPRRKNHLNTHHELFFNRP